MIKCKHQIIQKFNINLYLELKIKDGLLLQKQLFEIIHLINKVVKQALRSKLFEQNFNSRYGIGPSSAYKQSSYLHTKAKNDTTLRHKSTQPKLGSLKDLFLAQNKSRRSTVKTNFTGLTNQRRGIYFII